MVTVGGGLAPSVMESLARSRGRSIGPFLAMVVLVVLALGFGLALRPPSQPRSFRVALVGDSITDQARTKLQAVFPPPDQLRIEAVPGKTIEQMLPAARAVAEDHPDQVVLNLGSNDVLLDVPLARSETEIDELFGLFERGSCVHVVNVNETFLLFLNDSLRKHAQALNALIERKAADHGFRLIDWAKIVDDYYAAGEPQGKLTVDTVHPTDLGKGILADAYRRSVATCTPVGGGQVGPARLPA